VHTFRVIRNGVPCHTDSAIPNLLSTANASWNSRVLAAPLPTTIADEAFATSRDLFTLVTTDRQRVIHHTGVDLLAVQLFERLPRRTRIESPLLTPEMRSTGHQRRTRAPRPSANEFVVPKAESAEIWASVL
jgi:hypothetical protein